MTLTLELHDEKKEAAQKAKAQARGMSAEQYAQGVLDRDLEEESAALSGPLPDNDIVGLSSLNPGRAASPAFRENS